jgi:hypothetical protein
MTSITWTDRSRIETYQRCPRMRWLEYHEGPGGRGIVPTRKPLPLALGGSVHKGLEFMLNWAMESYATDGELGMPRTMEDEAVAAALADFATHRSALALDLAESTAIAAEVDPKDSGFDAQVLATARDLGMAPDDPTMQELLGRQRNAAAEFDDWLWREQGALVEGLVRAYARQRLGPLLEEFEVLEVEREGDWELAELREEVIQESPVYNVLVDGAEIRFMSRPDALLRNRNDNSLYLLSYKTAATWDVRKARDAEHDMQGLSEGIEVERRLGEWWNELYHEPEQHKMICNALGISAAMYKFLVSIPAPPRILGIRYEYLLKGYRAEDRDLSARFGIRVWSQRSHLLTRYVATSTPARGVAAYAVGDQCWSYDYHKEDGSTSKLSWQNWKRQSVWDGGCGVKAWIDALDATAETMSAYDSTTGAEPRSLGYSGPAQSLGFTATHPLDEVFPAPLTVYRQDDQLRDWIEQVEAQETRVVESVAAVEAANDEGERRHLLNKFFPMSRKSCSYPSECAMVRLCFGGEDIRHAPLESGFYKIRVPNHIQERGVEADPESSRIRS